jgi:formate hydrogenlyase subunit 6/NADH:ubiquinone oxidoreductase subunit I
MKLKKILTPPVVIICVMMALIAFFSYHFVFYNFSTNTTGYTMTQNSSAEQNVNSPVWFSYDNNQIVVNAETTSDLKLYALSTEGVTEMTAENQAVMSPNYVGSFIATLPETTLDEDGDGTNETVHYAAKTDMAFTQGYRPTAPAFSHSLFPLEITLTDRTIVTVLYNGEPLENQTVTLDTNRSGESQVTTNSDGVIEGLSVLDIRSGFSVTYEADAQTTYVMAYQVEDNTLFTSRYLAALTPLMVIVGLTVIGIVVCLILRKRIVKNDPVMGRFYDQRTGAGLGSPLKGQRKFGFMAIRWLVMILSFVVLIYGGKLLGQWFHNVYIPIFACPINQDQLIESSCYYLAHLNFLFATEWQHIALFFGSLILSVIILGRVICGFLCPMGLVQDMVHEIRQGLKIEGVALNEKLYGQLKPIKWTMLLIFLGFCFFGVNFCDFCPAITLSPAFAGFKVGLFFSGFMMVMVLIGGFFKRRFFCNICPLGYLTGLLYKISLFRIKKDCQACTECGACYEACPMGIKTIYTEREKKDVTTPDCIMCGECIDKCPENNALSMSFCGLKFYRASRKTFMSGHKKTEKKLKRFIRKREKDDKKRK